MLKMTLSTIHFQKSSSLLSKIASLGRLVPVVLSVLTTLHLSLLGPLPLACVKSIKCRLLSVSGLASCAARYFFSRSCDVLWAISIRDDWQITAARETVMLTLFAVSSFRIPFLWSSSGSTTFYSLTFTKLFRLYHYRLTRLCSGFIDRIIYIVVEKLRCSVIPNKHCWIKYFLFPLVRFPPLLLSST